MSNPTELPDLDRLRQIGELITTQDNRITEAPIFVVEQKTPIISDSDYNDCRVEWRETENGDYQLASPERAERLDALHRAGRDTPGWRRYEVTDVWTFVTACFTEQGCIDYLARNGHNLRETRIYAYGSYRNEEFRAVRSSLIALARRAKPEGEAAQAEARIVTYVPSRAKKGVFKITAYGPPDMELPPHREILSDRLMYPASQHAESGAQATLRETFEATMIARGYPREMFDGFNAEGEHAYYDKMANCMLSAWQAALAAQSQGAQRPVTFSVDGISMSPWEYIDYLHDQLAAKAEAPTAQQAAAPANTLLDSHINYTANMLGSAPGTPEAPADTERLDWLDQNIFHRGMDDLDAMQRPGAWMWVTFGPKGVQGTARSIIDAARAAQLDGGQGEKP